MNPNKFLPPGFPGTGATGQKQPRVDIRQAIPMTCKKCEGELYDQAFRLARVPGLAPGNETGQDVMVQYPVYVCRACGLEGGSEPKDTH